MEVDVGDKLEGHVYRNDKEDIPQYRFLLIGKSGTGKSATGNTLLGYEKNNPNAFKTGTGFEPTTLSAERKEITRHIVERKAKITVVDTPDIVHLKAHYTVAEWTQLICPLGEPFTVLLTIRLDKRYMQEDYDTYQTTKQCLGNLINNNLIIVFTHFDQENCDLKGPIKRTQGLNKVFQDANESYVTFDNSGRNETKNDDLYKLLDLIDAKQTVRNALLKPEFHSFPNNVWRFLILGKTGTGKSATANMLLGKRCFRACESLEEGTKICQRGAAQFHKLTLEVVDTPGIFTPIHKPEWAEELIAKGLTSLDHGPNVILVTISCRNRFTELEYEAFNAIKSLMGPELSRYIILVFTGVEERETTIEQNLASRSKISPERKSLVAQMASYAGARYVAFNNKLPYTSVVRDKQINELLTIAKKMMAVNEREHFCSTMSERISEAVNLYVAEEISKTGKSEKEVRDNMKKFVV